MISRIRADSSPAVQNVCHWPREGEASPGFRAADQLKARATSQRQTRERIVQATMELHEAVGPARTTIAEIARRAEVQRLTVYNHFPQETELFGACQAHWLALHPPPDPAGAFALPDPVERLQAVLRGYYGWYRAAAPMAEKIQRDRGAVAALDELMRHTADAGLDQLADALAAGFPGRARAAERQGALIRLALDFWTWRRLDHEGLHDEDAANLMARAVAGAGTSAAPPECEAGRRQR
jgi:AcrR family transcriptional regulator